MKPSLLFWPQSIALLLVSGISVTSASPMQAADRVQADPLQTSTLRVVVNSDQDTLQADEKVTLREAIEIVNGTRSKMQLTPAEKAQITEITSASADRYDGKPRAQIHFALPPDQTQIQIRQPLPPLTQVGTLIDGMTQSGAQSDKPVVTIVGAKTGQTASGLSVLADGVTIRGLSLIGFNPGKYYLYSEPSAEIVIGTWERRRSERTSDPAIVPKDVVIEQNWLGATPETGKWPEADRSAFGIYVFNGEATLIQNNRIVNHEASGVITGVMAKSLRIQNNQITRNGSLGMPDGIRLGGNVENTQILENKITENAGSGIYLFKTQGSTSIKDNLLERNSQRFQQAAIYLMGNGHQVSSNRIIEHPGAGVVIAGYPSSRNNQIQDNQFGTLQGLEIDLVSRHGVDTPEYRNGDGRNRPIRESPSRLFIANGGIDAPEFVSPEFFTSVLDGSVELKGKAIADTEIEIYQVHRREKSDKNPAGYTKSISKIKADGQGHFSVKLDQLKPGDRLMAIATHPDYGTSEPSIEVVVKSLP